MSYQTHGAFNETLLALFTASDGYISSQMKPCCGWRDSSGVVRVGTWLGNWPAVERAWAWNTWGKWAGAPPILYQAESLSIVGADVIREGNDDVFHIDSGAAFSIDWFKQIVTSLTGERDGRNADVSIYNCTDGSIVRSVSSPTVPLAQEPLPDGSYVIYVEYDGVHEGLRLPPGYYRDPQYDYTTTDSRLSHFNPVVFVGEIPADPMNPLNIQRMQLIANNTQQDNPDYVAYVTYEAAQNGEGSAIKLQVGSGSWAISESTFVTPSRALHELDFDTSATLPEGESPSSLVPVYFDPLAHVISFALHTSEDGIWGGKVLLGGARFTANGPTPALWQWNADGTATLLGVAQESCKDICEQALATGLVTGLQELQDGSVIMLTLCSRHIYDATGFLPEDRLPRYPVFSDGEPGGRCLTTAGDGIGTRVIQNAEALDKQPDPLTPSFYDVGVDIQGDKLVYFPGTLCHLDGSLWRHRGRSFGVRCDGDPTDDKSIEQITYYDGIWNKAAAPWNPTLLVLQRGASVNGINLTFGWEPSSETAQVVRDDGNAIKVLSSNYRVRGGTVTNNSESPNLQSYIMPAQKVIPADGDTPQHLQTGWALIEMDGNTTAVVNPPTAPADGRKYRVLTLPAYNPIYGVQIRDMMSGKYFESANADSEEKEVGIWLRVDSTADLDDWDSFIWRPLLTQPFVLPVAALTKVEMLIISKPDFAPEQLPGWGAL